MKYTFKLFQIVLLICGVFVAEADEVKPVSVMEGESVTLNTDVTETQGIILILWRFGDKGSTIAQINRKDISYPNHTDIFRGKLQLDQTGSLTIKNMRTKHSGLYKVQIDLKSGSSRMTFNVTVSESPSVVHAGEAEMKTVSVMEGNSVILQTDVTETHGDELIVWRFGDEGKLIAKHYIEAKSPPLHDTDERFRDRLQLDHQTGSLTITNTRTTDSGFYTVKISSNKHTLYKRFIVTVSAPGLSSGAVAGIVVVLLLVSAAAAAAGVIYHRRQISELERKLRNISEKEGKNVILNPQTEIQKDDLIQWKFGDKGILIAENRGGTGETHDDDVRFRGRLKLDVKTGSLTITGIRTEHIGVYKLQIISSRGTTNKTFKVVVYSEYNLLV
ncbi:coxsackievirus and adenovirus receptor homolog [Rhinichthys klamathensis goyatoka]|uniref:coxsackievirus and adenovirus receptor homolog n=1 Tax=Rhinichthys klamathensis goyatoka TaxID=3034132 RepID=UPI0024B62FB8|nr:coxsackievirus and adenovirus receptor homolog [Rhinichthys klamathensis goyatoka]